MKPLPLLILTNKLIIYYILFPYFFKIFNLMIYLFFMKFLMIVSTFYYLKKKNIKDLVLKWPIPYFSTSVPPN